MGTIVAMKPTRSAGPLPWALSALALACLAPATASAAPTISGTDADVWNVARPVPSYVISSTEGDRERISWQVAGVASGEARTPVTVRLPGLGDGSYRLMASERNRSGFVERLFRVDLTPPRIAIRQPANGAQVQQGATVLADYACQGAVTCDGDVATGAPVDTSRAGPASFAVRATDDAGNEAISVVGYEIRPATTVAIAGGAPPAGDAPAPIALTPPPAGTAGAPRPVTIDARRLRPRAGAVLTSRRPVLRWPAPHGVGVYNVQIFRLRATSVTKVLSAFPRLNRMRVPPRRLAYGHRYVWRVWPYLERGYPKRPLGLSFFDVRRPR
jgi:hypothetical protein